MSKSIETVVSEILTYIPQYRAEERSSVLADELNEHGEELERALRALPAEQQTAIGLDDIDVRTTEEARRDAIGNMLVHHPEWLPW